MKKLKIFLMAKWEFFMPERKKVLIYDGNNNPFSNYFKRNDYNVLYTRGERIIIPLLLKCLIKNKFNVDGYISEFISYTKPKLIITFIDNVPKFYALHKIGKFKTIFVQNGLRSKFSDIFANKDIINKKNKKNFKVDYMFVFNSKIGSIYNSFIKGKTIPIGSFNNNNNKINNIKKKYKILLISTFREHKRNRLTHKKITWGEFTKNDKNFVEWLIAVASKYKIPIDVLGRYPLNKNGANQEFEYFKKIFKNNSFSYKENFYGRNTYSILDKYKFCFTIDSTLGIESLARGGRVGFFSNRGERLPIVTRKFGWMEGFNKRGPFWTYKNDKKELERIFKTVILSKNKTWKLISNQYRSKIMPFDPLNKKFKSIIKNII